MYINIEALNNIDFGSMTEEEKNAAIIKIFNQTGELYYHSNSKYQHQINAPHKYLPDDEPRTEFLAMEPYCRGLGMDIGCGTNRLSETILTTDWYPHTDTDLIWNCVHDGGRYPYPFRDERFDFIFASHILEDFAPDEIQWVFDEWLRMIKIGGYLVILVPDMQNKRYPDWDEVFTDEDEEVKSGKRQVGETKGNPSHRVTMGMTLMDKLTHESKYNLQVVQADTLPHNQMTLDYVIKRI